MSDPMKDAAAARDEVMKCEAEIQSIKVKLRRLGTSTTNNDGEPNTLEISLLKVEDLPEGAKPHLSLQLSSPVEEGFLSEVFDPLNNDPAPEGSLVSFQGVEISQAMLTITAKDADIPLGTSASLEVATLCKHDAMDDKEKIITELPIAILAEGEETAKFVIAASAADDDNKNQDDQKKDENDDSKDEKDGKEETVEPTKVEEVEAKTDEEATTTTTTTEGEEKTQEAEEKVDVEADTKKEDEEEVVTAKEATATAVTVPPVCTITLRFTYSPSPKDRREELYELLNKTSQRKATALENLRRISMAAQSSSSSSPTRGGPGGSDSSSAMTKPAVKSGFLNKGSKKVKEPTRLQKLYDRALGPNSILMRGAMIVTLGKNYIIFFGAMAFFHFQGQMLALPPPV